MHSSGVLYLGIKGTVLAFDRHSGARIWEKKLKGQGFVTLLVDGDRLVAATHGEVFCLDATHGNLLWHDPLRGYGYGLASLAAPGSAAAPLAAVLEETQRRQAAAAAAQAG